MSNVQATNDPSNETKRKYFVNYNQDVTSIAVGSKSGFRLYSLHSVDDLELIYNNDVEDTFMVERLFSSSLVSLVTLSAPRKLKVCHFKKGTEICNYSYSNTILAVRMNRSRLVVCLEESLYIHNIRDMKVLHTIRDTPPNPQGLCALTVCSDNCLLAYPGSATMGEVQIFDAYNLHAKTMIPAHDSPLAALAFNSSGTKIATASERGTVIRVFNTIDGGRLYEFRRGVKRCVDICSLAFSVCGQYLCCSSNTETVHVFKIEQPRESPGRNNEESWMGYLSSYLPQQVTGVFTQGRAFATAHLPISGIRNVVAITTIQNQARLLVATEEAILYIYNLDSNEGGDLILYKQHHFDDNNSMKDNQQQKGTTTTITTTSEPQNIDVGSTILGSYAGIVKGNPKGQMSGTESDKLREMAVATETPPLSTEHTFHFNDDQEYPPLTPQTTTSTTD